MMQALFLSEAKEGTKVVEDNSIQTHIDLIDEEVKEKMRNVWHPLHSSQVRTISLIITSIVSIITSITSITSIITSIITG